MRAEQNGIGVYDQPTLLRLVEAHFKVLPLMMLATAVDHHCHVPKFEEQAHASMRTNVSIA